MVEMFATGDVSGAGDVVADDYIDHQGLDGDELSGVDGFVRVVKAARDDYSALSVEVVDLEIADETVRGRLHWTGQRLDGVTDERDTTEILRVIDGRAVEHWGSSI